MALVLDTTRQLRSLRELTQLVEAISKADKSESEPDWLEWKREADLSNKRWHAVIGKFISGFANRDPVVARREAGGCAYLVLGVEPGNVLGVSPIDNAVLQARVSRYVRETVRWSPQYIEFDGKHVLVITIEPPQSGDLIAAMLKSYQSEDSKGSVCREGDVFTRHHGRTDLATQEAFDMLARRISATPRQPIAVTIETQDIVTALPVEFGPDVIDTWCDEEWMTYMEPVKTYMLHKIRPPFENRNPVEFRSKVEAYISDSIPLLRQMAHADALEDRAPGMRLVIVNKTESNYADVRVDVSISGDVWAYPTEVELHPEMPQAPREWGERSHFPLTFWQPPIQTTDLYGSYITNDNPTQIEFDDEDVRPFQRVKLEPIHLVCDAKLAGATLTATWTATSTSVDGVVSGKIDIQVSSDVVSPLS